MTSTSTSNNLLETERTDSSTQLNDGDQDDDDVPQLSNHALAALQSFYSEQDSLRELLERSEIGNSGEVDNSEVKEELFQNELNKTFPEDWQLSQFWYDEETSKSLANEVLEQAKGEKIACISCPSIFRACNNSDNVFLFEYDKRFKAFGSSFHFYDYNKPEDIADSCVGAFSVIIADPPFLSEECLENVSITVKKIMKANAKIILCTGRVMEPHAERLLNLKRSSFIPQHKNNLGNEFACFTNYDMTIKPQF